MGLLGGFKAKFRSGTSNSAKNKTNGVVCVKFNVTQEFDPQPGQSSSYKNISEGSAGFKTFTPRVKSPQRIKLPEIPSDVKLPSNGHLRTDVTNNQQAVAKQPTPVPSPRLHSHVATRATTSNNPLAFVNNVKPAEKPTEKIEIRTETSLLDNVPPKPNYSTHPLVTGNTPTREDYTFEPQQLSNGQLERPTTLKLNNSTDYDRYFNERKQETFPVEEDEEESGNFQIHFASHKKTYTTDDEEEEDEEEDEVTEEDRSPPLSPMDYSSQATSIFFGDDDDDDEHVEEHVPQRSRNITMHRDRDDEDKSSVGSSASA